MTKYDDLKEFADSTEREIKNCPVDGATHTIAMSHKGWRDLIAAIRSLQEGVRVPREPSVEALKAGVKAFQHCRDTGDSLDDWRCFYRAVIAAAAAPPAQPVFNCPKCGALAHLDGKCEWTVAQPQDEPVAWMGDRGEIYTVLPEFMKVNYTPLYKQPRPTLKQHTALELLGNAAVDYARAREGK
jgi:hypothetical protein